MDFPEQVEIQRSHPVIVCDTREEIHKNELAVSLSTVARLLVRLSLRLRAAFHNDDSGRAPPSNSY